MSRPVNKFGVPYHAYTLTLDNGCVKAFDMAWECYDIYVCPDAYLRMLKYYPEDLQEYTEDIRIIGEECVRMIEERIAKGDNYSVKVLKEAKEVLERL